MVSRMSQGPGRRRRDRRLDNRGISRADARRRSAGRRRITLVESHDIGILGVGEGTFPTIRKTLSRIGIDEAELVRRCGATFKQGAKFVHWRHAPGTPGHDHYLHAFQETDERTGPELLPYWLLGVAGDAELGRGQHAAEARRGRAPRAQAAEPSRLRRPAQLRVSLRCRVARRAAARAGHRQRRDACGRYRPGSAARRGRGDRRGARRRARRADRRPLHRLHRLSRRADRQGARPALEVVPRRAVLRRRVAIQVPYARPDDPIASYTISTAQQSGWTWDIGLEERRGIGHVYSSAHTDADEAERVLRGYIGPAGRQSWRRADSASTPAIARSTGTRTAWRSAFRAGSSNRSRRPGSSSPKSRRRMIANLFPWAGDFETSARQFNANMQAPLRARARFHQAALLPERTARQPVLARQRRSGIDARQPCTNCSTAGGSGRRTRWTSIRTSTSSPSPAGNTCSTAWAGKPICQRQGRHCSASMTRRATAFAKIRAQGELRAPHAAVEPRTGRTTRIAAGFGQGASGGMTRRADRKRRSPRS